MNLSGASSKEFIEKVIDINDGKGYWVNNKCITTNGLSAGYGYQIVVNGKLYHSDILNDTQSQYQYERGVRAVLYVRDFSNINLSEE